MKSQTMCCYKEINRVDTEANENDLGPNDRICALRFMTRNRQILYPISYSFWRDKGWEGDFPAREDDGSVVMGFCKGVRKRHKRRGAWASRCVRTYLRTGQAIVTLSGWDTHTVTRTGMPIEV